MTRDPRRAAWRSAPGGGVVEHARGRGVAAVHDVETVDAATGVAVAHHVPALGQRRHLAANAIPRASLAARRAGRRLAGLAVEREIERAPFDGDRARFGGRAARATSLLESRARAARRRAPSAADRSGRPAGPSTRRRSPARARARGRSAEEPHPTGCTPRRGRRGAALPPRRREEEQASPSVVSWPSQGRPVATCVPKPHPAILGENAPRVEAGSGTPGHPSQGTLDPPRRSPGAAIGATLDASS